MILWLYLESGTIMLDSVGPQPKPALYESKPSFSKSQACLVMALTWMIS